MIGFPDRAYGMSNHLTLLVRARTPGQQVPDTTAEVSAAQQRVEQDAEEQDGAVEKRELVLRIRPGHGARPRLIVIQVTARATVGRAGALAVVAVAARGERGARQACRPG